MTDIARVGLFVLDSRFSVHEAVFYGRARADRAVSLSRAQRAAASFAQRHGSSVSGLRLRTTSVGGRGRSREYAFTWQRVRGAAWLPTLVLVRVSANGTIESLARDSERVRVPTRARIAASRARSVARHVASRGVPSTTHVDGLAVATVSRRGAQRLVWMVSVRRRAGAAFAPESVVWVDARTGRPV